jgi:hypothetical protein
MDQNDIQKHSASRKKCKVSGKPLRGDKDIGPTCEEHFGLLGKYYVHKPGVPHPDIYISLKELCDLAEEYGKSRYWMVKQTGGDAGVNPPIFPEFTIYIFDKPGTTKYCRREAIAVLNKVVVD